MAGKPDIDFCINRSLPGVDSRVNGRLASSVSDKPPE
jgi:hypothetical protein